MEKGRSNDRFRIALFPSENTKVQTRFSNISYNFREIFPRYTSHESEYETRYSRSCLTRKDVFECEFY